MNDQEIAAAVQEIVTAIPHDRPLAAAEAAALAAAVSLATNFLQNINAIAKAARSA